MGSTLLFVLVCLGAGCVPFWFELDDCYKEVQDVIQSYEEVGASVAQWHCGPPIPKEKPNA